MNKAKFKQDKGQTGLTILLSLVVMLFTIGLLIMIFVIMSGELKDASYSATTKTATNKSTAQPTTAGVTITSTRNAVCTIDKILNSTVASGELTIASPNWTLTNCLIKNATDWTAYSSNVRITYSYTYDADNTATTVINDTGNSIATTTDWFDIFIVIGAMVVLILLTVIIITAIRGSGMAGGGEMSSGAKSVGTA